MQFLLEHFREDTGGPLLTRVQNMFAQVGMTAEEGPVVCATCVLILDTNLIGPHFIICLSLKATMAKRWSGLGKLVKSVG